MMLPRRTKLESMNPNLQRHTVEVVLTRALSPVSLGVGLGPLAMCISDHTDTIGLRPFGDADQYAANIATLLNSTERERIGMDAEQNHESTPTAKQEARFLRVFTSRLVIAYGKGFRVIELVKAGSAGKAPEFVAVLVYQRMTFLPPSDQSHAHTPVLEMNFVPNARLYKGSLLSPKPKATNVQLLGKIAAKNRGRGPRTGLQAVQRIAVPSCYIPCV
ncbi:hypothetical protein H9P43_006106 [Blastocladiella emersonii ATCC 22665]|nr:hypothetical protein H9P43_006106 [Blastocladiella emersonii ATCC 22665]